MQTTYNDTIELFKGKFTTSQVFPATAEQYDQWSGTVGDCVASANNNHQYRGFATPARSAIVEALVAAGHARTSTGEGKDKVWEKEEAFVARLVAGGLSIDELNRIGNEALTNKGITFQSTLAGGVDNRRAIGKEYTDRAKTAIAAWERGTNTAGAPASAALTLAKVREKLPTYPDFNDATDVDEVARMYRAYDKAVAKESLI